MDMCDGDPLRAQDTAERLTAEWFSHWVAYRSIESELNAKPKGPK